MSTTTEAPAHTKTKQPSRHLAPQDIIDEFWSKYTTKSPGNATAVIPHNHYAEQIASNSHRKPSVTAQASYDEAAAMCRAKVHKIIKECRRINKRYRDPHFDLEADLKHGIRDCLQSLDNVDVGDSKPPGSEFKPRSVKRVVDIFDKPRFYIDGPTADDVRQGRDGDCWLMAALCTLSNKKGLIERLCVAHDEEVGVYGFVFHRDGEWISEIVDDYLYLTSPDYEESWLDRTLFDDLESVNPEEAYRRIYQANSSALFFASCRHPQETWLALLEKAYAKAHGDYAAVEGGYNGEGIEDLTGGVTSELFTGDVLDKEHFWREELLKVNELFLFGCSTGVWGSNRPTAKGIVDQHSYSVQRAVEVDGHRLVRLRNPWGKFEWKGPWSDGSAEWTPEWLEKLEHRFGDDGDFWIAYEDLLRKFQAFDRTRLFTSEWRVSQEWTTLWVPWTSDYHDTHFTFSIKKPGPAVIVLSQLDYRYFRGLEGQYRFELAFRIHKAGCEDYIVRSQTPYRMRRSVNVELELEEGDYQVLVKVTATRLKCVKTIEQVIRENITDRRDKFIRIGLAYDLAHSKGNIVETPEEKEIREKRKDKELQASREQARRKIVSAREEAHYLKTKKLQRAQQRIVRKATKRREKEAARNQGFGVLETRAGVMVPAISQVDEQSHSPFPPKKPHVAAESETVVNETGVPLEPAINGPNGVHFSEKLNKQSDYDLESIESLSDWSERELDLHAEKLLNESTAVKIGGDTQLPSNSQEEPDEFEKDPWNASVVVGLRVYHKTSSEGRGDIVNLKVVRPRVSQECTDGKTEDEVQTGLDVDDSSKDATLRGGVKERKQNILGDAS